MDNSRRKKLERNCAIYAGCRLACTFVLAIIIILWFYRYKQDPFGKRLDFYAIYGSCICIVLLILRRKHRNCRTDLYLAKRKQKPSRPF